MKHYAFALALVSLTTVSALAMAQYTGPSAQQPETSISAINAKPKDDAAVKLEGYLVKQLGGEKFTFSDGKDEIRVDIDKELMPKEKLDEKTKVSLTGEVEKDFMESPEVDVDTVTIIK